MNLVVAGNYEQYKEFVRCTKDNPINYRYVPNEQQLRGYGSCRGDTPVSIGEVRFTMIVMSSIRTF